MDNQSIAKILRDFGDDYAGAAEWVRRELTDAKHDQFLGDKIAHADQLTTAEEQLAEMRTIVEQMIHLHEMEQADELWIVCPSCNGNQTIGDRICGKCGGVGLDLKEGAGPLWDELFEIAKKALSAAPKRGRVVAEPAVNDNLALCKPVRCEYHVGPPWPDPRGGDCGQPVEYLVEWGDESRWYVCGEHATSIEEAE